MVRTLLLSLVVVGTAVAVAVGAVTALADKGGPEHGVDHGVANGLQEEGGADGVGAQGDGEDGEGAEAVAQSIADTFGVSQEEVLALHDSGVGFGAIFKLFLLAETGETTVEALVSDSEADGGFAFGKRFKELTGDVSGFTAGEDGMAGNLGQALSDVKNGDQVTTFGADDDGDGGPPDHAPAHGWRR